MELVEDEWDRDPEALDLEDLLFVTYNSLETSTENMVQTVEKEGFKVEIRTP